MLVGRRIRRVGESLYVGGMQKQAGNRLRRGYASKDDLILAVMEGLELIEAIVVGRVHDRKGLLKGVGVFSLRVGVINSCTNCLLQIPYSRLCMGTAKCP